MYCLKWCKTESKNAQVTKTNKGKNSAFIKIFIV